MKKITAAGALTASLLTAGGVAHADSSPLPDFRGLVSAISSIDPETKVEPTDVSGLGREVLWPAQWKVCDQAPAPGARNVKVLKLGVVKKAEQCPARTRR